MERYDELDEVFRIQQGIQATLMQDPGVLRRFFDSEHGFIKKRLVEETAKDTHTTCTAFCLYYLVGAYLVPPHAENTPFDMLGAEEISAAVNTLGKAILDRHSKDRNEGESRVTATGPLPNQYNSAIEVAGYLRAARMSEVEVSSDVLDVCTMIVEFLLKFVNDHGGYIPRIPSKDGVPSPYFTFWASAVFDEWMANDLAVRRSAVEDALVQTVMWAERELASGIACHHADLASKFDIIEVAYSILTTVQFQRTPERQQLAKHGLSILFENYFRDGCFAPSAPVLADQHNYSLQVPTAEVLALLFMAAPDLLSDYWPSLCDVSQWLCRHRKKNGWYSESEGRHGRVTAFMTTSSLVFLAGLSRLLDDVLCQGASEELEVPPYTLAPNLSGVYYPGDLEQILSSHTIKPLRTGRRNLASYSMILYGPPGTAKTTIARKLAQDLRWPLLIMNQSDFLQKGIDNIDAEADRIFRLASYLKEVVILFDEVEELVVARERSDKLSRLLTTSMLPRIHYLRDRQRVVFIFATNHLDTIDSAASRLGRFDIIRCVMPPTEHERKVMLQSLLAEASASQDLKLQFETRRVAERTEGFTYGDLRDLVRRILVAIELEGEPVGSELVEKELKAGQKAVKSEEVGKFEEKRPTYDRPSYARHR